ncbi:MAG: class I SAM-dependent methyltransferase [Bacteroidota bacterium]
MSKVKGTIGYAEVVHRFIKAADGIPFEILHHDFLKLIPTTNSLVLDIGAGFGRDAHILSMKGHEVIAVEPLAEFRKAGKEIYAQSNIKWIDDAFPDLGKLEGYNNRIDFILSSGVWHHLNESEQEASLERMAQLLKPNGIFAVSLRHGPAGAGTHVFPINYHEIIEVAKSYHLQPLLTITNQPSLMKNKEHVTWSRLALKKQDHIGQP